MQVASNLDAIFCELESSMCHMTSMSTRELTLIWLISVFKVVKIRASRLACPNAAWGTNRLQLTTKYGSFCWSIEVLGRIGDKSLDFFPLANRNFLERRNDLCSLLNFSLLWSMPGKQFDDESQWSAIVRRRGGQFVPHACPHGTTTRCGEDAATHCRERIQIQVPTIISLRCSGRTGPIQQPCSF
jgi:hypothetical protein